MLRGEISVMEENDEQEEEDKTQNLDESIQIDTTAQEQ